MNWYFSNTYIDYNIKPKYIEQLPIKIDNKYLSSIEKIIEQILEVESNSKKFEELENKIDQLVYKIYDLTEEEIKIVETK